MQTSEKHYARVARDVPHLQETLTFVFPLEGPGIHSTVMGSIDEQNLWRPTTAQVLSLVDFAMANPKDPVLSRVLDQFRDGHLWTATQNMSFPGGACVYDNIDGKMPQTKNGLMKLIEANDRRVRFTKPYFSTGDMSIADAVKNPHVIAQIGEEMLPVYERIAKNVNPKTTFVFGLNRSDDGLVRYTTVYNYGSGLSLVSSHRDDDLNGCAPGVLKSD